jgi:antibiotic biosynthesis monooxygenase (ABM) superfamily enzyme
MDQTEYDVFISYSRKDYVDLNRHVIPGNALSKIKDMLTQNGLTYWFDEEGIYSGQEFTSVITKAIRTSQVFVFVSSKHSNSSVWTSNEIAIAKRLNKPIIPFCLDDSPYNDSVMMLIAALDYIDGRDQNTAYIKLVRSINYYTNKEIRETDEVSGDDVLQGDTTQEQAGSQEYNGHASWYEKLVNPSFTFFQKLLVYFQLGVYSLSLFFVIWTSLFGALAVYHHFQLSQLLLMLTLVAALYSTIKLRTGKVFWWAVICICDFLAILYVSVLANYLY